MDRNAIWELKIVYIIIYPFIFPNFAYLFLFRRKRGNSRSRERTASQTELLSLRLNTSQTCPSRWASVLRCLISDSPRVSEVWAVSPGPGPLGGYRGGPRPPGGPGWAPGWAPGDIPI